MNSKLIKKYKKIVTLNKVIKRLSELFIVIHDEGEKGNINIHDWDELQEKILIVFVSANGLRKSILDDM
ncbi:MAG: hypothetical protein KAS39_05255 [Actinomycetia bacterium]|nr:hypothetical protein [Actinomycetes bacterium]